MENIVNITDKAIDHISRIFSESKDAESKVFGWE